MFKQREHASDPAETSLHIEDYVERPGERSGRQHQPALHQSTALNDIRSNAASPLFNRLSSRPASALPRHTIDPQARQRILDILEQELCHAAPPADSTHAFSISARRTTVNDRYGGGIVDHPDDTYEAVRLKYIDVQWLSATVNAAAARRVVSLHGQHSERQTTDRRPVYWSANSGIHHEIVVELNTPCLIAYVELHNRSTSSIEVYGSLHVARQASPDAAASRSRWQLLATDSRLPHNKLCYLQCGSMPVRSMRIRFVRGTPVAVNQLSFVGVPTGNVFGDGEFHRLLVTNPAVDHMLHVQPYVPIYDVLTYPTAELVKGHDHAIASSRVVL